MEAKMRRRLAVLSALLASFGVHARPQVTAATSMIATTTTTTTTEATMLENAPPEAPIQKATISKLHVRSDIQFRYSRTQVKSYIKNPSNRAQKVEFEILLPEKAFVSNFTIETKNEVYVSEVKEKQEARDAFESAASSGYSAGLVDAREGNVFSVQTNVPASEKLTFTLTYEQLLERQLSKYEQSIHVDPKQIVDDLKIDVYINESLPITNINVPELKKSSNEIVELLEPNSIAVVEGADTSQVHVQYHPSRDEQIKVNADKGITGHFIVQYDVNRKQQVSEVQVLDGYFVHFFAPEDLPSIPKHVVFVLDVSGSMSGEKIKQLKDSMVTILDDLNEEDFFSIVTFSNEVEQWRSSSEKSEETERRLFHEGTEELRNEAMNYVLELNASGGTNIYDALSEAVRIVDETVRSEKLGSEVTPVVIFLTDGQPSSGPVTSAEGIREHVKAINEDVKVPIYGIAFGGNADFEFVKSLSLENLAYARRIYEGSDAAIQLEDFYKEICSPLLTDVTFKYVGESFADQVANVRSGATFHKGSEFVTVGKINPDLVDEAPEIVINAISANGLYQDVMLPCPKALPYSVQEELPQRPTFLPGHCFPLPPVMPPKPQTPKSRSENFIQRLWAKMTIDQLLDDKNKAEDKSEEMERKEKALKLSLEYNFVTDLTSLVVVKPDEKDARYKSVAKLTPVGTATPKGTYAYQYASNFAVYGANAFPSPKRRTSPHGLRVASTSIHGLRAAPSFNKVLAGNVYSATLPPFGRIGHKSSQRRQGPLTTTTFPARGTSFDSADYYSSKFEDDESSSSNGTSTTCPPVDTCQLRLHTKTYLRGRWVAVSDTVEEFTDSIGSSVTSLEAVGPCTWKLFSETRFGGDSEEFVENKYNSAVLLRKIFRNVKSIKKTYRC